MPTWSSPEPGLAFQLLVGAGGREREGRDRDGWRETETEREREGESPSARSGLRAVGQHIFLQIPCEAALVGRLFGFHFLTC